MSSASRIGLVERQDDDGDHDRQRRGARRHRGGQDHRRRQVAVLHRVVLADDRHEGAAGLGPLRHLERGGVEVGGARAEGRRSHVEPEDEHRWLLLVSDADDAEVDVGEAAVGDAPPGRRAHQFVVVEATWVQAGLPVGGHEDGVDVAAGRRACRRRR